MVIFFIAFSKDIAKINLHILLINLIPIKPLDGSKVLEVILDRKIGYNRSRKIINIITKIGSTLFIILGIVEKNITVFLIGIIIEKESEMSKLNDIERIINRKERFLKKGVYPIRHIAVLQEGLVNDVIKKLDFDSIHLINILDDNLRLIKTVTEEQVIENLIEKGTNITFNDIIAKQNNV